MKASKIYLLPAKFIKNAKGARMMRMLFMAGMLLLTMPAMAQYYSVTHNAGTIANVNGSGRDVTVTSVNSSITGAAPCGIGSYREGNGTPGYFNWAFSAPVEAVRIHFVAIELLDAVSFEVNGVPYLISPSEVNALPVPCLGDVAAATGGQLVAPGLLSYEATVTIIRPISMGGINSIRVTSANTSGGVANDFTFQPILNVAPVYTAGATTTFAVCQDAPATDITINSGLEVTDNDLGQTETFSVTEAPMHGVVNIPGTYASGGTFDPTGITYTPNAAYWGPDSFVVKVDDGTDTAIVKVYMTVKRTPNVTLPSSFSVCNTANTSTVGFSSNVAGATYAWVNDNNIGNGLSGSGDSVYSFAAVNTSTVAVVAAYTVTPTANGCIGTPDVFSITANPTPHVDVLTDQELCNNTSTAPINFTSDVTGATYTWSNSNTNIGVTTTGNTDIPSFTATNTGTATIEGIVTIMASANGCDGPTVDDTITVYPTPKLSSATTILDTVCNNTLFHYEPISATTGATFAWERAAVTDISNGANAGTGNIDETLVNTTVSPATSVAVSYTYTVSANGCDNIQTVGLNVKPTLLLTSTLTPDSICDGAQFSYVPTSTADPLVTYQWNRPAIADISNASATNSFNPLENLDNTTNVQVPVTYTYYVIMGNCFSSAYNVVVKVNPTPMLTTTPTPAAICDSTLFTYGSGSNVTPTAFTWSRATVTGISNPAASGVDTIREYLHNTDANPVTVVYVDTLTAFGCQSWETVTVTVNPSAILLVNTPSPLCSATPFDYVPASATIGATYAWSRAAISGISNAAGKGTGDIHETLINTTPSPITVTYIDTLTINGCKNTDSINLVIKPTPRLSSTHTPTAICDRATFNYTPTSATTGSSFSWTRAYVLGIDATASAGTDNPNEQLINTTYFDVNVVYVYTLTANGCNYNADTVTVKVRPTPLMSSEDTVVACSNARFTYSATSSTPDNVKYTWKRAKVAGITPNISANLTADSTGVINETLIDSANFPINTLYKFTLYRFGCTSTDSVLVKVNPAPYTPSIAIKPSSTLCAETNFQNFGAATAPPAGSTYRWTAIDAYVMAVGNNKQNSVISFYKAGVNAKVILTSDISITGCKNADTFTVSVGTNVSSNPKVIYYNSQFMGLQNDVATYQWGYDDALTLDSTLIPGEINQVYFDGTPDFNYKHYWLMTTTANGCMQKTYFNAPAGITNVNAEVASIKVYPNPTNADVNVEINATVSGDIRVDVLNLLGQKVNTTQAIDHKATINVASLPAGMYLVDCYREGVKVASAKFIKN